MLASRINNEIQFTCTLSVPIIQHFLQLSTHGWKAVVAWLDKFVLNFGLLEFILYSNILHLYNVLYRVTLNSFKNVKNLTLWSKEVPLFWCRRKWGLAKSLCRSCKILFSYLPESSVPSLFIYLFIYIDKIVWGFFRVFTYLCSWMDFFVPRLVNCNNNFIRLSQVDCCQTH